MSHKNLLHILRKSYHRDVKVIWTRPIVLVFNELRDSNINWPQSIVVALKILISQPYETWRLTVSPSAMRCRKHESLADQSSSALKLHRSVKGVPAYRCLWKNQQKSAIKIFPTVIAVNLPCGDIRPPLFSLRRQSAASLHRSSRLQ